MKAAQFLAQITAPAPLFVPIDFADLDELMRDIDGPPPTQPAGEAYIVCPDAVRAKHKTGRWNGGTIWQELKR